MDDSTDLDPEQALVRRRAALKLLLGSASATAIVNAPQIVGITRVGGYAAAASGPCSPPAATFTHVHNPTNWQASSGALGFYASGAPAPYSDMTAIHLVEADPPADTYPIAVGNNGSARYTSTAMALEADRTYTFSFDIRWRDHTTHVARQRLEAQYSNSTAGPWTTGFTFTTTLGSGTRNVITNTSGSMQIVVPPTPATTTYYFRYRHTFLGTISTNPNQRGNDIAVTSPTITCA
jgi:hypothetical protein